MKLSTVTPYLKKPKKYINHVTLSMSSAGNNIFSMEIRKMCYIKKKKYRYRLHFNNNFNFRLKVKGFIINMAAILIMLAKLPNLGFLKIKLF